MKKIILSNILIIAFLRLSAQDDNQQRNEFLRSAFYISPTQLIFPEILVTYEHLLNNKFSLSYSLGYKIPIGKGNKFEPFGDGAFAAYEYQYLFNKFSNAVYISIAPSYFLGEKRKYFIQCELFNRFYLLERKQLSFDNVETYRYNSIRSERNNVTGLKILFGRNKSFNFSKSLVLNIKLFSGLGLRCKIYHYENVNNIETDSGNNEIIIPYEEENGTMITPSFHLGAKIGISKRS